MRAAVVRSFAEGPRYESFDLPHGEGIPIDVLAASLSPRTRSGASGAHYASSGALPMIPGIDGVGRLAGGERVYFLAAHDAHGSLAEKSLADPRLAVLLPEGLGASVVAAGMLPAISSWVVLAKRVPIATGQRVLVLGATGTSGRLAVQIAKHLGASEVIAVGRTELLDLDAVAAAASEVDIVLDYLWGSVATALMPAICKRREAESRALHWVIIGSMAGDEIALSGVLLRKRNLHILGSGQGATTAAEMFGIAPQIVEAFANGTLLVEMREVPLAEVGEWWTRPSKERIVFVP